jgi:methyl-accepting chemotaxis protein
VLVDSTGAALAAIMSAAEKLSARISDIAGSSKDQSTALSGINTSVGQLDSIAQQNAAMFEETTAANFALTSEANALAETISQFKVDRIEQAAQAQPVEVRHAQAG